MFRARPPLSDFHRSRMRYASLAFGTVVLTCFSGYFYTERFFQPAEMVPLTFFFGAIYVTLGILTYDFVRLAERMPVSTYFTIQCALLTVMNFASPLRGFFGLIVLPLASQALFHLKTRHAVVFVGYLFSLGVAVWGIDFGLRAALEVSFNYAAAFAFTIAFSLISRQSLEAHEQSERLRAEIEQANVKLRDYAVQAEELATARERNRLAREIHDGVGHYLTVVKTQLDVAAAICVDDPARAKTNVEKAARLTAEALDDVRRSVGSLRTDADRPPLAEALAHLATLGEPQVAVTLQGEPRPLPPVAEHALYRAAQEGLTNIRKHAEATSAALVLDFRDQAKVRLEISDNGRGASAQNGPGGFGLTGIRERVELLGGKFECGNRPDGGFFLAIEVPA